MSRRWSAADIAEYDAHKRSAQGFVDFTPSTKPRRAKHESPYLFAAAAYCRAVGMPEPEGEFYFDPQREWRLDLAWPSAKTALEIDGGNWVQGAHTRAASLREQYEKQNAATLQGWRVLRCEPRDLAETLLMVKQLLAQQ